MKLLSPEETKSEKSKAEEERIKRVGKLQEAETTASKSLNQTKARVESEIKRLDKELADHEAFVKRRKGELTSEVEVLESRRADAMKPIKEMRQEAESLLEEAKTKNEEADENLKKSKEDRSILVEKTEDLVDRESSLDEREELVSLREANSSKEESRLKESQLKLAESWKNFHKEVHEANISLARREKEVADGAKANEVVRLANEAEAKRIVDADRAVADKYKALEQAYIHLGINPNGKRKKR